MRPSIFKLLILFNFFLLDAYGHEIAANTCDSTLLTKKEYEKCKSDTAWTADILIKTNYIIKFKTSLLPKYRLIRRDLNIPATLQNSLEQLKLIYDIVLNRKLYLFQTEMDRNQRYVQPKAYLSSLLSFQVLRFYPDIHAILLHDIHLQLKPKSTSEEQKLYKQLFDKAVKSVPADLYQKLIKITNELSTDDNILMEQGFTKMFNGSIQEGYRSQCDIINFLLWTE
jgi:hypothetical protein